MFEELKAINALLFKKGESYSARIRNVSLHESEKAYPARYLNNDDAIGIEIVGAFDAASQTYDTVNKEQNNALTWLVEVLEAKLSLGAGDVYTPGRLATSSPARARQHSGESRDLWWCEAARRRPAMGISPCNFPEHHPEMAAYDRISYQQEGPYETGNHFGDDRLMLCRGTAAFRPGGRTGRHTPDQPAS